MGSQLPPEARGVAAAVLTFSFISEFAGLLLIWLVWTHRERTSCKSSMFEAYMMSMPFPANIAFSLEMSPALRILPG